MTDIFAAVEEENKYQKYIRNMAKRENSLPLFGKGFE